MFGKREVFFVLFRYLSYGVLAIRGIIFAYFLGPFFLGIYGFLMLYQQYLSYSNLGIQYSVNSEFAVTTIGERKTRIVNSALTATLISSLVLFIAAIGVYGLKFPLFPYKDSYQYVFILFLITVFSNFQQIFINIFRAEKLLYPIIISELIIAVSSLSVVPFYSGINLVNAIFYAWSISLFCVLIYFVKIYKNRINFECYYIGYLLKLGFPILIYGFSYFLMNQLSRTLIGIYYPINVMGYFSFANNITTAVMLGLDTITWIIFPSVIGKLASEDLSKKELSNYLVTFTNKLTALVSLIICFSIILLPVLFQYLSKYKPIEYSLIILLVNQIVFNTGFAFISFCIARKMHRQMAVFSLLSVVISGVFSLFFCYFKTPFIWLVVSNVIASFCFLNMLIYFISKKFELPIKELRKSFSWIMQFLFFLIVIAALIENYYAVLIVLILMLFYKHKSLKELYKQMTLILLKK